MKFKKKELIIALIIAAACLIWWGIMYYNRTRKDYGSITITVQGQEYGTYSLGKDQVIEIGETNTCTIKDGQATMTQANCPDHLCMYMSPIGEKGGVIICLPNEVVIEGTPAQSSSSSSDLDTVSGFTGTGAG